MELSKEAAGLSNRKLLAWMFGFMKPVRGLCVLACIYLAVAVGVEVLTVRQMGNAVNRIKALDISGSGAPKGIWAWFFGGEGKSMTWTSLRAGLDGHANAPLRDIMLVLTVLTLAVLVLGYLRQVANMRLSMTMVYYIRSAVYDKLQRVGFAFHDAVSTGQLITRALTDLQNVRAFLQTAVLTTLEIALTIGGYMALLLTRNPWIAALSLVPLPFWTIYILRFGKKVQPASRAQMEAEDRNVGILTENIAGVHVVKAFATEPVEIRKYFANCDTFYQRVIYRIRLFANFTPVIRGIAMVSHLSLFLMAGIMIVYGKLDVGDLLILGAAMGAILGRLQQVAVISDQYQSAIVSARRLYEVLMAAPTVPESPDARPLPDGGGTVRFEDVTFGYDPAKPVLRNVSFAVPAGAVVAIVGPTGAGKTSLVSLIARFYDPQAGRVFIDDADLRQVTLDSLRRQVAFVFQETYLFSDTVAANIAYGRPRTSAGEIEAASRLAQAHEFIEKLPKGYDSMLGERGASLSGGQRQRLAIARAILFNPRILVLDDATAAVDPETEDLIRRGMNHVMQGRTTFLIAHRISTVKRADIVIVLEEGRVTQVGTHNQLMSQDGHYRQIAALQLSTDEEPGPGAERPSHMDRVLVERDVAATAVAARGAMEQRGEEEL